MSNKLTLSASDRVRALLDDSSFVEIGSYVTARCTDFNTKDYETPADGVVTGYGTIDGRLVYVYSQDATVLGGSIGEMHAAKIAKIYDMALKMGAPVIGLVDCAGLRLQEATDSLNAFGSIYLKQTMASGVVPQITGVFGVCGGGAAVIPGLSDITFMVKDNAQLFVNSPNTLDGNYKEKLDTSSADYQEANSALVDEVLEDEATLLGRIRQVVAMLPSNNEDDANYAECADDLNREIPNLEGLSGDARTVLTHIADNNIFVEFKKEYAKDMIIGLMKLGGTTVGCIANQVQDGGDVLSTNGAYIAAEFVNFLDAFNIPILTLTNVKGYKATIGEEKNIAKAVAKLTYAFANATSPKVNLVMGDAYGSAYLTMNSKSIGADIEYAWKTAKIGTMDADQAVKIMYADELSKKSGDKKKVDAAKEAYVETMSSAISAAKRGFVDDIIDGAATRKRLIAAFEMLYTKREDRPIKKHGAM
ncbi:MAG: carboxyl transferase domain-containing protein [Eubacteriales bacterium]|nr:carboxyl transferase domain-containing protein [Eubacteriales bacterium]